MPQAIFATQQYELYHQLYEITSSIKQELQEHSSFDESALGLFTLQQDIIDKLHNLHPSSPQAEVPDKIQNMLRRIIQLNKEITACLQRKQVDVLQKLQESQRVNKGIAAYRLGKISPSSSLDQQS